MQLPAPAARERMAILKHEIQKRSLQCADDILTDVASKCDGYDAYDLVLSILSSIIASTDDFFTYKKKVLMVSFLFGSIGGS